MIGHLDDPNNTRIACHRVQQVRLQDRVALGLKVPWVMCPLGAPHGPWSSHCAWALHTHGGTEIAPLMYFRGVMMVPEEDGLLGRKLGGSFPVSGH